MLRCCRRVLLKGIIVAVAGTDGRPSRKGSDYQIDIWHSGSRDGFNRAGFNYDVLPGGPRCITMGEQATPLCLLTIFNS
ncbi:hypothetical protein EDD18DRAFT_77058 [Armillaria luteobubalina]|uniref:Secreted protein n=1 Tax=Armillaria luteobubalina TaxID=153913 RepID=A0AA39U8Z5_9AGAR|nr:hypothetical protein EDD18DRAFT_77058 [Armillaria luteobubalina]